MDDLQKATSTPLEVKDDKRAEIKANLLKEWDKAADRATLAKETMEGYIFGKYANGEHYPIDLFVEIIAEIDAEKVVSE